MIKRLLRWLGLTAGVLAAIVIIAYTVVYILSERVLQRTYQVPAVSLPFRRISHRSSKDGGWRPFTGVTADAMGRKAGESSCLTNR